MRWSLKNKKMTKQKIPKIKKLDYVIKRSFIDMLSHGNILVMPALISVLKMENNESNQTCSY